MRSAALILAINLIASPVLAQTRESPPPQAIAADAAATATARPGVVKPPAQTWETGGKTYNTYEECVAARKKAEKKGALIGALVGGGATALLGGNVGKNALGAGAGALVGSQVSKGKKC